MCCRAAHKVCPFGQMRGLEIPWEKVVAVLLAVLGPIFEKACWVRRHFYVIFAEPLQPAAKNVVHEAVAVAAAAVGNEVDGLAVLLEVPQEL